MNDLSRLRTILVLILVVAATFLLFAPSIQYEFIGWDDDAYIRENPHLKSLGVENVRTMFSQYYFYSYTPLTLLSHAVDYALWKLDPRGHHLTNVILHACNTGWFFLLALVVFGLAYDAEGWAVSNGNTPPPILVGAAVASLLFAWHPLRVETVACVSDRKDLLSAFFLIPATILYLRQASGERPWRWSMQAAVLILFILALLAKSTALVWPVVMILLDVLFLNRVRTWSGGFTVLREKLVFILAALVAAWLVRKSAPLGMRSAYVSSNAPRDLLLLPFSNFLFYWEKFLWPSDLVVMPKTARGWSLVVGAATTIGLSIVSIALVIFKRWKAPALVWWSAMIGFAPTLGFIPSAIQPLADRYTYLALSSAPLLAGAGYVLLEQRIGSRKWVGVIRGTALLVCAATLGICAALTSAQMYRWSDAKILWTYAIHVVPDNPWAYNNLGAAYFLKRDFPFAAAAYEEALAAKPDFAVAADNLGNTLLELKEYEKARVMYERAYSLDRSMQSACVGIAGSYNFLGKIDSAAFWLEKAIAIDSSRADLYSGLGSALEYLGRNEQAREIYKEGGRRGSSVAIKWLEENKIAYPAPSKYP